jgi:hypothetical protein
MIVLTVTPVHASTTRGQLFDAAVDGRAIVARSTQPLLDAARALLAEGIDPRTWIVMRHAGTVLDALRSTVGVAAGLTVKDDGGGKPVFGKWHPYDAPSRVPDSAPMRQTEAAL